MPYLILFFVVVYLCVGLVYVIKRVTDESPADAKVIAGEIAARIEHGDSKTAGWLFFWPAHLTVALITFIIYKLINFFIEQKEKK